MRSSTTVYRADGSPIEVVTLENEKSKALPTVGAITENLYETDKLVESKPVGFTPRASNSEPDK